MTRVATLLATAAVMLATVPASAGAVRDVTVEKLSQRLFPLLDAIGRDAAARDAIMRSPGMSALLAARQQRSTACASDLACNAQALIWTDAEVQAVAGAVAAAHRLPASDDGRGAQARRELEGLNIIVQTYGLGQVSRYPKIDGSGPLEPLEQRSRLQAADWLSRTPRAHSAQGFDASVDYALALLDGGDRIDAIGFDPLTDGLNAAAMARAKSLDWKAYRYSAMIVTGVGPEVDGMALSPWGKYHLRLAASRFAKGETPFIIVSGGRAHPRATPFTEAEEMRNVLIERHGIPADAILIEPYARHTTTNLRNAARLAMAMGAPLDRDMLIVCNPQQSGYIESPIFAARNMAELGYEPGKIGRRLSPTELLFRPSPQSARVDPRDPLDP
nr:YdcF family protein [Sphingomonas laterariae]